MHIKSPTALMGCLLALTGTTMAAPIMLVENGKPAATIVIANEPTAIPIGKPPTVTYAAEELQRFIEKASGARLAIVPAAKAPAAGTLLLVGRSALSKEHKLAPPTKPEGLRIVTFARGVAILGEVKPAGADNVRREVDRGTLHGVYEFLEHVVGYRFFIHIAQDPDLGIVTPMVKTLTVPPARPTRPTSTGAASPGCRRDSSPSSPRRTSPGPPLGQRQRDRQSPRDPGLTASQMGRPGIGRRAMRPEQSMR